MKILLLISVTVLFYSLLSIVFKVPSFASARAFKQNSEKTGLITDLLDKLTIKLTPKIKLLVVKKSNLEKLLSIANDSRTPEELVAKSYVNVLASLCLLPLAFFIEPMLCAVVIVIAILGYRTEITKLKDKGEKRQQAIEHEMMKFVMYMANALNADNNPMSCIESYKTNFETPLTEELTHTLADMKIGNYEQALKNMQHRNNSDTMSQLTDGLLSAMKGDDTKGYFSDLGIRLTSQWEVMLERQALLKKPKITQLSLIMFAVALVTIGIVLAIALSSSSLLFGGTF